MTNSRPLERRQLTVLFCDMVASTSLSLRLDPEELTEVIQAYRQRCDEVITRYGGVVARYVGDGVLAYFGYPRAQEDDAERAIRAGLAMTKMEWSSSAASRPLQVRIGIATGVVVVGRLPQEDLSAIGSAPNLAARLQGLADPNTVIVSAQTRRLSRGLFEYRTLGLHDLKGFEEPVPAWQVIGERRVRSRFHALRARSLTPLVDRKSELDALALLWQSARAGEGQAVLLTAEAGVGKSRLAEVVSRRVVERDSLRLWYYCSPNLQSSPFAPLIRQLALAAGFLDTGSDEDKLGKLAQFVPSESVGGDMLPLLASLLSVDYEPRHPALNMSPQRQKQALLHALVRLLEAFASRGPLLIVVEDLHWIDPSSDELLGLLMDRLGTLPILAILTARPEYRSHWDNNRNVRHISLDPLGRADSISMIRLVCRERTIPAWTIQQIADSTDGLPLFIEDLTRDVLEVAQLAESKSSSSVRAQVPFAIPATLNDSLMSRLDRLGSAKAVAQVGAVIGREFSRELLGKVANVGEERLGEDLHRLVESGLLVSRRATQALSYAFKHALVRDAAYSSLLKKEQAALHARIALALVEHFPDTADAQPEVVAHHFRAANDVPNAVAYLVKAAKTSARRSGFVEAIAQLEVALELLRAQPKSLERTRLELGVYRTLGGISAEYRGFSSAECGDAYTTALQLCRELGNPPDLFAVLSGLGSFEITRAGFGKCRALAEECLARARGQSLKPPFVMGHLLLGGTMFLTGDFHSARAHLEEAISIYEQDQMSRRGKQVLYVQDQKSTGLCYLALTLTIMGRPASGTRAGEQGLEHSRSLGGLHTVNFSLCYLAAVHYIRGDVGAALERATQSLEIAREQGFATWVGISQMVRGAALVSNGQWAEGLEELARGLKAHTTMEASTYQPFAMALMAQGLIAVRRLGEAVERLDEGLAMSETTGERFYAAELQRLKGEALARSGSVTAAEQCLREAVATARRQTATLFELRGAISLCRMLEGERKQLAEVELLEPACRRLENAAEGCYLTEVRALIETLSLDVQSGGPG
jgi:class 3 adenylate cyclase/tetratricopeptide (TPR) repeat protein